MNTSPKKPRPRQITTSSFPRAARISVASCSTEALLIAGDLSYGMFALGQWLRLSRRAGAACPWSSKPVSAILCFDGSSGMLV